MFQSPSNTVLKIVIKGVRNNLIKNVLGKCGVNWVLILFFSMTLSQSPRYWNSPLSHLLSLKMFSRHFLFPQERFFVNIRLKGWFQACGLWKIKLSQEVWSDIHKTPSQSSGALVSFDNAPSLLIRAPAFCCSGNVDGRSPQGIQAVWWEKKKPLPLNCSG